MYLVTYADYVTQRQLTVKRSTTPFWVTKEVVYCSLFSELHGTVSGFQEGVGVITSKTCPYVTISVKQLTNPSRDMAQISVYGGGSDETNRGVFA